MTINHDLHLHLIQTLCLHLGPSTPLRKTLTVGHYLLIDYFQQLAFYYLGRGPTPNPPINHPSSRGTGKASLTIFTSQLTLQVDQSFSPCVFRLEDNFVAAIKVDTLISSSQLLVLTICQDIKNVQVRNMGFLGKFKGVMVLLQWQIGVLSWELWEEGL